MRKSTDCFSFDTTDTFCSLGWESKLNTCTQLIILCRLLTVLQDLELRDAAGRGKAQKGGQKISNDAPHSSEMEMDESGNCSRVGRGLKE